MKKLPYALVALGLAAGAAMAADDAMVAAMTQNVADMVKVLGQVDTAQQVSITVQGERDSGSVVVLKTDPEWAAVAKAVKDVAAKRKKQWEADLAKAKAAPPPPAPKK
jgi:hypothetical protein